MRYADDFVIVFTSHQDAARVWTVLPQRFAKYGLTLHEQKTRLVDFRKPQKGARAEPFHFLGFTHYWGKTKSRQLVVMRKTARNRLRRSLKRIAEYCDTNRHAPLTDQHKTLCQKVRGHYNYYGVAANWRSLSSFLYYVRKTWRVWLNRRSQNAKMTWDKMLKLLERYPLPNVRIVHRIGVAKL